MPVINSTLKDFLVAEEDIKVYFLGQKDEGKWVVFGGYTFEEFQDFPFEYNDDISVMHSKDGTSDIMGFRLTTSTDEDCLYECKHNTFWSGAYKKENDILLEGIVPKGTEYFPNDEGKLLCAKRFIILKEA